jgi:hypothetical protein
MRFVIPVLVLGGLALLGTSLYAQSDFAKKREAIQSDNPKDWLKLAAWCEKSSLPVEAEFCLKQVLKLDADNAEAKKKLGSAKNDKPDDNVGWAYERKIQGPHWTIYTDASDEIGRRVLEVAESVYDAFIADVVGLLPMAKKPLRAYVFKDRARFMKEANLPTAWAEGYYDGGRRACFCYYDPTNAKNPFHWFVHEATHQLLAEIVVNCSGLNAWLSEGYACHFGTSRIENGVLKLGTTDPNTYPAWFRKQYPPAKLWPLAKFDAEIAPKFGELRDPNPFYLESWLLVRFLIEHHRDAFRKFFAEAAQGRLEFEKTVKKFSDLQADFLKFAEAKSKE